MSDPIIGFYFLSVAKNKSINEFGSIVLILNDEPCSAGCVIVSEMINKIYRFTLNTSCHVGFSKGSPCFVGTSFVEWSGNTTRRQKMPLMRFSLQVILLQMEAVCVLPGNESFNENMQETSVRHALPSHSSEQSDHPEFQQFYDRGNLRGNTTTTFRHVHIVLSGQKLLTMLWSQWTLITWLGQSLI
jgi:hypothetical protein